MMYEIVIGFRRNINSTNYQMTICFFFIHSKSSSLFYCCICGLWSVVCDLWSGYICVCDLLLLCLCLWSVTCYMLCMIVGVVGNDNMAMIDDRSNCC